MSITREEQAGSIQADLHTWDLPQRDRELLQRSLVLLWRGRDGGRLDRIAEHALIPAGKLLRPLLVLEAARAVGGYREELAEAALALEYLHVATLIHDDIIDHDDVRRGRPSVQAAFGVPDAIVAGDGLLLEAFAALVGAQPGAAGDEANNADVVAAVAALAAAGIGLCRGQLLEAEFVGKLDCPADRYLTMARLKTGVLFECACRIGALLGGGPHRSVDALGGYGRHLGTAFQIRDDLLGFDAQAAAIGKPRESDVQNRRPTLPILLAYQNSSAADRGRLERAYAQQTPDAGAVALVRRLVEASGAREAAQQYAAEEIRRAKRRLAELPAGDSTLALGRLADYALERSS